MNARPNPAVNVSVDKAPPAKVAALSETPLPIRKYAAPLGEDNEYVYREVCGYTADEYRWFVENGHAGTEVVAEQRGPGR